MTKTLVAAMLVVGAAGAAEAGGQAGSIGVGAEFQLSGAGGASLNLDQGEFHVGGFLGFADEGDNDDSTFELGGRFYYHVHSTAMSDFGVGGSIGIVSFPENNPPPADNDRLTAIFVEPAMQIRLFLASNVAFSATTGIVIGVSDAEGVAVTGSALGSSRGSITAGGISFGGGVGLHYYFF